MTHAVRPLGEILRSRAAREGGAPLLTWYGAGGARTELSVSSVENWVAKTVNLLAEADVEAGSRVRLEVSRDHPAHWMSLIWALAVWDAGASVDQTTAHPDLVVTGPQGPDPATDAPGFACSLDAWARPLPEPPAGLADYTGEALAQPDAALPDPLPVDVPAWVNADTSLSLTDLAGLEPIHDRVLIRPADPVEALQVVTAVLLGGGSLVLAAEAEPAVAARIADAERARIPR